MPMQLDQRLKEILTPREFEIHRLTTIYTVLLANEILEKSGIADFLKTGNQTVMQVIKGMKYKPFAMHALGWLLNFNAENSLLSTNSSQPQPAFRKWTLASVAEELLAMDKGIQPLLEYLSLIAEDYPKYFTGEKMGSEIVFSENRMKYWQYYFANEFTTYKTCNAFFGAVVADHLGLRSGPFRVLEIGAGTGGGTVSLINSLKQIGASDRLSHYTFTDVSVGFLKNAETLIPPLMPRLSFDSKRLDINEPLSNQGCQPQSVEVIYSLNCLHVAKDLVGALKQIHDLLVPGGQLCLGEAIRAPGKLAVPDEMIFCLLSSYTDVRLKPGIRPTFGFLSPEHWQLCLKEAGFAKVEILTSSEAGGRPDVPAATAVITAWKAGS
jgi:SAM-dependent methyltransferase